ncbi:MAG: non-homologous end-joining DNA ligase [Burkholderiaceae bacterium]
MKSGATQSPEKATAAQRLTHPERVIDRASGCTKADLAHYYAVAAPLILPHLAGRPVALLRAPDGVGGETFFQKHLEGRALPGVTLLDEKLDPGHPPLLTVDSEAALLALVQMNTIELHTWNATADRIERPDRLVIDLDPGEGVAWPQVQEAARQVRALLASLGLVPFLKTSGGKGLHVVVPITRLYGWDAVRDLARRLTERLAAAMPERFTAVSGPRNRVGRIYPDYLRNGRGATTVAAWSVRARPGLGVSVPIAWDELDAVTGGAHWTLANVAERLRIGNAPWDGYGQAARALGSAQKALETGNG